MEFFIRKNIIYNPPWLKDFLAEFFLEGFHLISNQGQYELKKAGVGFLQSEIFLLKIKKDSELKKMEKILSLEEKKILAGFKNKKRQTEWILGRLSVKIIVWSYWATFYTKYGINYESFSQWLSYTSKINVLPKSKSGAPDIILGDKSFIFKVPEISLSHTAGLVALRWSEKKFKVGLDIEKKDRFLSPLFLKKAFSPEELMIIKDKKLALKAWCAKECAAKACKTGLVAYLNDYRINKILLKKNIIEVATKNECFQVNILKDENYLIAWL